MLEPGDIGCGRHVEGLGEATEPAGRLDLVADGCRPGIEGPRCQMRLEPARWDGVPATIGDAAMHDADDRYHQ
jgi:hypothetical protein